MSFKTAWEPRGCSGEDKGMIGYHYTAKKLWRQIEKQGLKPYQIRHPELRRYFRFGVKGIWIWNEKLSGIGEVGSILWQVTTKDDHRVVKLKVEYEERDVLKKRGRWVELYHNGHIGVWNYHDGTQTSHIIISPIPPERIELVKEYNLLDLVKNGNS